MNGHPPEPSLASFTYLAVFVHPNAPFQQQQDAVENLRFAALGRRLLPAAYTDALFRKRELGLHGAEFEEYIATNYQVFVDRWVTAYGWRALMLGVPEDVDLNDPAETKMIFETYAGAVQKQHGYGRLSHWIAQLVDVE